LFTKHFGGTFQFLVFSSIYIAFVAVGMVHQTALLFNVNLSFSFYAFVLAGTLCSYNFHWFFTQAAGADVPYKAKWHIRYRKVHLLISLTAIIAASYFAFQLIQHWEWLLLTAIFVFLYSAPKVPMPLFRQLKNIAYGKTVFLALAWMHVTTMLPFLVVDAEWSLPHYLFALHRFFLIYAICILFDLRDREQDQLEGIKSMITQMSTGQVSIIYYGILVCWAVTAFWLAFYFPFGVVFSLLVPGLWLLLGYGWFKKQQCDYVYYFMLDGLMVISYPLMLLFEI